MAARRTNRAKDMITDTRVDEGFEAITSLSRSVADGAGLPDVGPLLWVLLRQMVPCDAMALLGLDASTEQIVVRFAAGEQARRLEGVTRPAGSGIAGWVAANRRSVLNAEPVFDFGPQARAARALRSSVLVPLVDNGTVVAVLALYSKDLLAFTEEHVSILELLASRMALTLSTRSTWPRLTPFTSSRARCSTSRPGRRRRG